MTTKNLVILGGVAVVLVGAAVCAGRGSKPQGAKLNGRKVLPSVDVAKVVKIEIGDKLKLAAGDKGWTVETLYGYPADRAKIAENLLKLTELKVGQVARGRELGESVKVTLRDASGAALAEATLGDKHLSKPRGEMGGYGGYPDGRYVEFEGQTVLVTDALSEFDGDAKKWCETKICDEPWMNFGEVVDPKTDPAVLGFATGVVAKVKIGSDTNRTVTVGACVKGGTDRYVKFDNSEWVYTVPSYSVESLLPKPEKKDETKPKADADKPKADKADADKPKVDKAKVDKAKSESPKK